jgi:polyhydroxybutyrate depolymerase
MSKISTITLILSLCTAMACEGTIEDQKFKMDAGSSSADQAPGMDTGRIEDMLTAKPDGGSQAKDMGTADMPALDTGQVMPDAGEDLGNAPEDMPEDAGGVEDMAEPDMAPLVGSSGCRGGAGIPEGEQTFMLSGKSRRYIMRLPQNYDPSVPSPVVLALHGNGGNPSYWDSQGGARDIRAVLEDKAILIVASAIDDQWRDYSQDSSEWPARIEEELEYFDKILNDAKGELCVDEDRIFAMGFSGGGSFSGVLGCRRRDIRAIAVGGSVIYFDQSNCVNTPAAWITIGAGEQAAGRTAYLEFFRDRAGCAATSMATAPSPCVAYDMCGAGTPVHYCEHAGGHQWPGIGDQAMWDFFSQF